MAKQRTSFTLSPEALERLAKLAKKKRRSKASTIEELIFEADAD